jgi:dihydrolipoamide dehydrogenase
VKKYEVIVVGSGCGMIIVEEAVAHGLKVALVDRGPLGGTCLNTGCIPSKMLINVADRIVEIQEASKLGIKAEVNNIDFNAIMERMRKSIKEEQGHIRESILAPENLDFYQGEGRFVADYTIEVNGERIRGEKICLASGSRVFIPPIKGVDTIDYLTSESVLQLKERLDSLIIVGGGYVGVEYGHFFAAMGTKVTILEMVDRLILAEEPEISELLKKKLSERMDVYTKAQVAEIKKKGDNVAAVIRDQNSGQEKELTARKILMAVGRRSNADLLQVENTGVETDPRGFIKVNEHLETSKKNIFAVGDADGQQMFTHVANREAALVAHNVLHGANLKMDYSAAPHAVYSHPQIASVGLTEENARRTHKILVGRTRYFDVAQGEAMVEKEGFAKAVVEQDSGKLLGFHIIGPYAPILIQEAINAMTSGGHVGEIQDGMHIHPALSELIPRTLIALR